jgi:ketosteroid isomerase-like protein
VSTNLDLVRSIFAEWERGDFGSTDWAHPEIEHVMIGALDEGTARGQPGMARQWRQWLSAFDDLRAEAEEYHGLDAKRVLVLAHVSGRGKTSGVDTTQTHVKAAALFCLDDGKVTKLVQWWDRDRALADLGLAAEGDSQR